jgi:hypothetical protein
MIRGFHLAVSFTLANAACGMASVFASMTYLISPTIGLFTLAAALVPLAPLIKSPSKAARNQNIKTEIAAGKRPRQAVAIGYAVQRGARAKAKPK